jgi:hypothetical protein
VVSHFDPLLIYDNIDKQRNIAKSGISNYLMRQPPEGEPEPSIK